MMTTSTSTSIDAIAANPRVVGVWCFPLADIAVSGPLIFITIVFSDVQARLEAVKPANLSLRSKISLAMYITVYIIHSIVQHKAHFTTGYRSFCRNDSQNNTLPVEDSNPRPQQYIDMS